MNDRVQKVLSQWGIASRRRAERMILEGRVKLNGIPVTLGQKVNLSSDRLEVDGVEVESGQRPNLLYILLNKPAGVVSTCSDPQNRIAVLDLLPPELHRGQGLHPVGRLDLVSTGALLLTNDGSLTLAFTHPRYHLAKTYHVWVDGDPPKDVVQNWRDGVILDGTKTLPAEVEILERKEGKTLLEIVLREGRNRQIRRVAAQLGYPVLALHRLSIGSIELQSLADGKYRFLSNFEINSLKQALIGEELER
jgi:23S rRNA pseudouridine2605 synthase